MKTERAQELVALEHVVGLKYTEIQLRNTLRNTQGSQELVAGHVVGLKYTEIQLRNTVKKYTRTGCRACGRVRS